MAGDILFCPIYNKYLNEMLAEKNKVKTNKEKLKIMSKFASKFTLLPEQFSQLASLCGLCNKTFKIENYYCLYSQYYGDSSDKHIEWCNRYSIVGKLQDLTCHNRFQIAEEALTFPHGSLEYLRERILYYSVSPFPPEINKKYNNSLINYVKLKKCENDIDKWLEIIKQLDNKEAIVANLELKIGQGSNWKNKKLWKFYFAFLKENNRKEILDVFRKYTRLYICDKQAVTEYRNELDKFSSWNFPTTKYWIDTIKYQIQFGTLESAYRILERALKAVMGKPYHFVVKHKNDFCNKLKKFEKEMLQIEELRSSVNISKCQIQEKIISSKPTVYYQNPEKQQYFCFHHSFIQNLLKNANGTILRKLYSSCKFFYAMKKAPLCYRIELCNDKKTSYCQEALYVNEKNVDFAGINNLQVYEMLNVEICVNPNLVSQIHPKLKYFNAKYIFLRKQNLTIFEFQMLLSKNLFQMFFKDVEIKHNEQDIDVKCFFEMVNIYPEIDYIEVVNPKWFVCRATETPDRAIKWLPFDSTFRLETIYLEHQTCSSFDLKRFINFEFLKSITLKNVTVKNENGSEMEKQKLEEFIKVEVNQKNKVEIEIL